LPELFLTTPLDTGPAKGRTVDLDGMVRDFYEAMGWDEDGNPAEDSV
jgi:aldehyde:ferredoxin oxidoreductase